MEPPLSAFPLTVLEKSSRHCAPQRMSALNTTAAFWYKVVRNIAGTVRMICREMTPAWRTLLTWLTQLSTATLAQRKHKDDLQLIATRCFPWPQCWQRYSR